MRLTGMLMSMNVMVWFILMETDSAKRPAIWMLGFLDKSKRTSELFSGRHSASAMAASVLKPVSAKQRSFSDLFTFNACRMEVI